VHGLPGCAYDWTPLADALAARGVRAIAYDRVGYGYSDARTNGDFTVEGNARDLVALLASEDLREATLVGWSYGGPTVFVAAAQDPTRVARLVLVGSGGPLPDGAAPPLAIRIVFSPPVLRWIGAIPPLSLALQREQSTVAFSGQPQPGWWLPQLAGNFARPHTRTTFRLEGQNEGSFDQDPAASGRPILLIHGDDDRVAPLAIAEGLYAKAPGSELVVVPGGSHMLPITHAGLVAERIASFAPPPAPEPAPAADAPLTDRTGG
jgi:pimeloyl-ACP methyl ester carboxylesterase